MHFFDNPNIIFNNLNKVTELGSSDSENFQLILNQQKKAVHFQTAFLK